ncbi:MAG: metallophosphoesterase [Lachnospiraceae bacterium]
MKVLIVSDTHSHHSNLDIALQRVGDIDMLIHLGDVEGEEEYIKRVVECPIHMVAGNNDFFSTLEKEEEFSIGGYQVFITHGHYYYVSMNHERIKQEARERKADIVMFGHTHKPLIDIGEDVIALNPGSLSYPRQEGRRGSFILMDIDRWGEAHFTLNYI